MTKEGSSAAKAFDSVDSDKSEFISVEKFEDLLDEVGEGFHGAELMKQIKLLDPQNVGSISRTAFINWYCKLTEGGTASENVVSWERTPCSCRGAPH